MAKAPHVIKSFMINFEKNTFKSYHRQRPISLLYKEFIQISNKKTNIPKEKMDRKT